MKSEPMVRKRVFFFFLNEVEEKRKCQHVLYIILRIVS